VPSHSHYPLFVNLERRVCLVVGGGAVAERKIRGIIQSGGSVRLVAEKLTPWLQAQHDEGTIQLLGPDYSRDQLQEVDLVFAATSDFALNRMIAEDADRCRLWCNMATEPDLGSFIVPSLLRRGPLTIAVSTSGTSPAMAVRIREQLEHEFGPEWMVLLELMARLRASIQAKGLATAQNQDIYRKLADLPLLEWIREEDTMALLEALAEVCHPWLGLMELTQIWNEAWKHSS